MAPSVCSTRPPVAPASAGVQVSSLVVSPAALSAPENEQEKSSRRGNGENLDHKPQVTKCGEKEGQENKQQRERKSDRKEENKANPLKAVH
ncbi:hypothetical protein EYF80_027410 [Liparis tanakae]|uniref:Uncharacterized protein n=1 Tax=Liparis tanakae TaxID=230148 RepID=A0A4Z2H9A4_9TELE|nr:hypothetical protein EYF80_027410 [Liparis tanakae]